MDTTRHGIIGLGFFGEKHAEALSGMPGVGLAAVCTRRPGRLEEVGNRFKVAKRFTDYKDLLADKDIDTVSVVTHVDDHCDITLAALEAGKHVFLEKPMAGTVAECDRIVAAADKAEGQFMVGHVCRFDPRITLAKEAVDQGRIGRIVSMHAARNLPANISAGVLDKISPLMGDGIHDTDLMLWLTQSSVETVYAQNVRVREFKYPDIGWAMYRFASGAVGVIETAWYLPENTPFTIDARMEIIGTEGALYIDCGNAGLAIHGPAGMSQPDTVYWPEVHGTLTGTLPRELAYFIECVQQGRAPDVITAEESRQAVAVMCAAEESAESGQVVKL